MGLSTEKELLDWKTGTWLPQGIAGDVGRTRSLGIMGTNSCTWSGEAIRSYCIAWGTLSGLLWWNMMKENGRKRTGAFL